MATPTQSLKAGFSLIEIVVVVAVVGILIVVGMVALGQWKHGQAETAVKNDLKTAAQTMEDAKHLVGRYPLGIPVKFTASDGVDVAYAGGSSTNYCLNGSSTTVDGIGYYIQSSNAGEILKGSCPK